MGAFLLTRSPKVHLSEPRKDPQRVKSCSIVLTNIHACSEAALCTFKIKVHGAVKCME